jgi:hypothetical protein
MPADHAAPLAPCAGEDLDRWVEDYLEGILDPEEAARFERALLRPEVADALGEALLIREMLAALAPDAPPDALVAQLEQALGVSERQARQRVRQARRRFPRLQAALGGASWTVKGPALGLASASAGLGVTSGGTASASSRSVVRASLAPVTALRHGGEPAPKAPKPPWWRRALRRAWRRSK